MLSKFSFLGILLNINAQYYAYIGNEEEKNNTLHLLIAGIL